MGSGSSLSTRSDQRNHSQSGPAVFDVGIGCIAAWASAASLRGHRCSSWSSALDRGDGQVEDDSEAENGQHRAVNIPHDSAATESVSSTMRDVALRLRCSSTLLRRDSRSHSKLCHKSSETTVWPSCRMIPHRPDVIAAGSPSVSGTGVRTSKSPLAADDTAAVRMWHNVTCHGGQYSRRSQHRKFMVLEL